MIAEQAARCFWPLWTVIALSLAPLIMGWHEIVPLEVLWGASVLAAVALVVTLIWGIWKFRWPRRAEAVARVDASLPGRPISTLEDTLAIGATDSASQAVWAAHLRQMRERTRDARAVEPDLRVSSRDPYGLRFIALLFLIVSLGFGSLWRVTSVPEAVGGGEVALAAGPVWEGWIEPPSYTDKPSLYLADLPEGDLELTQGSRLTLRLYGEVGALTVTETVSGRTEDLGAATDNQQVFDIVQDGTITISGDTDVTWTVTVTPDALPEIEITGPAEADAMGEMSMPFAASDDYAVVAGQATITIDVDRVTRTHGLLAEPEAFEPLIVDLPMPFSGDRGQFEELLIDDFSQHPFANMPVTIVLSVADAAGQNGESAAEELILPGRRFFQPVARAVIEQRRDLMWSMDNGPRVLQLLRAISHRPEELFTGQTVYIRFNAIERQLERALESEEGLTSEVRDELVVALWDLAIQLEDGSLADARERLARAQERLEEAMRNGASEEEIAELMQELREATQDYMQLLADETDFADQNQTDQPDQGGDGETMSGDEIQQMMDRIQELMEEGRMAEAMELMEELNELLENLRIVQGEGGEGGPRTPGQQSMEDLADTLREQQELADDAFRELQEGGQDGQDGENQQPGQQPGQQQGQQPGQQPGDQPGQQPGQQSGQQPGQGQQPQGQGTGQSPGDEGQGQGTQNDSGPGGEGRNPGDGLDPDGGTDVPSDLSLAERQEALRGQLEMLQDNLPALSGEEAEAARRALEDAETAMDEAEQALRENDLAGALDRQAEALERMREGMRNLGSALAENETDREPGEGETAGGNAEGQVDEDSTDPLGRQLGNNGQFGTDDNMLQGPDVYRRAEELLEELRRRAGELERSEEELDYLRRLLDQF